MLRRRSAGNGAGAAAAAPRPGCGGADPLSGPAGPDRPEPPRLPGIIGFTRGPTRREWRRAAITFGLGVLALFVLVLVIRPQPQLLGGGASAPAIVLQSDTGQRVDGLQSAAHHDLVVEFFDTQCDTCQRQAAHLCALAQEHAADVFVAVDAGRESAAAVAAYGRANQPPPCPVTRLLDPDLSVSRAYRAAVVPTLYVVDSSGKIAYAAVGSAGVDGLAAALQRLGG